MSGQVPKLRLCPRDLPGWYPVESGAVHSKLRGVPLRSQAPVSNKTALVCQDQQLWVKAGLSARWDQSLWRALSPGDRELRRRESNKGLVGEASSSDVSLGAGDGGHARARGLLPEAPCLTCCSWFSGRSCPMSRSLSPGSDSQAPVTLEPEDGIGHTADTGVVLLGPVNSAVVFTCR